jgi:peptidoglycan hydrolase CwlO-like protein
MQIDFNNLSTIATVVGSILTAIISSYVGIRKVIRERKKARNRRDGDILQAAKDQDSANRQDLESKIHELDSRLSSLKENVEKDIGHLKELHNAEFKNLAEKIENLRTEIAVQHSSLIELLTKIITDNK